MNKIRVSDNYVNFRGTERRDDVGNYNSKIRGDFSEKFK